MITQQASIKHADRDLYAREKVLNSAIIAADISNGWVRLSGDASEAWG